MRRRPVLRVLHNLIGDNMDNQLFYKIVTQIQRDLNSDDMSALRALLKSIPIKLVIKYLSAADDE
jgi:hypothetical protein